MFVRHFADRAESERRFFGAAEAGAELKDLPRIEVAPHEINGPAVEDFIRRQAARCAAFLRRSQASTQTLDRQPARCAGTSTAACRPGTAG